jgi:RES domain-containing protein
MGPRPAQPDQIHFGAVAFRYSDYDMPFWARANTLDGRWHCAATQPTQYLSLSPDAAWADRIRHENLRNELEVAMIRMPLWVAMIDENRIADYATFDKAEAAGFPPDALVDDDWTRCQEEGERLRALGFRGVLAPASALPGEKCVTLFGGRRAVDWDDEPLVASAIRAKIVTVGSPPTDLVHRVRFFDEEHSGYVTYAVARGRRERGA